MKNKLLEIGIKDNSFQLFTVAELIKKGIIEKPLDGNHGEIHPKGSDFVPIGVPFIMASNINNGLVDYVNCKFISEKQADSLQKGFAKNDDVLLTHKASIGRTAIVNFVNHPYVMLTPQVTYYRVNDKKKLNNNYLKYYFDGELFQKTILMWASSGSTRAYIGITAQQKLPIILPPIDKQIRIAEVLTAYDNLIETNNQRIATLEQLAQQIYKEWFVRMRFPGWEQAHFHHGVPDGWKVKKIGELCSKITDGSHFSPAFVIEGKPMASVKDMLHFGFSLENIKTISEQDFDKLKKSDCSPQKGDILIAKDGSYLKHVFVWGDDFEIVILSSIAILRPHANVSSYYLALTLKQDSTKSMMSCYVSGAALPRIILDDFKKMKILIPEQQLLAKFDEIVKPLYEQIKILIEQNDNLVKTRNVLLPRLISGKLTIKQAENLTP